MPGIFSLKQPEQREFSFKVWLRPDTRGLPSRRVLGLQATLFLPCFRCAQQSQKISAAIPGAGNSSS